MPKRPQKQPPTFQRHKSARSILQAFFRAPLSEVEAVDGEFSGRQIAGFVRKQGMWAFVETHATPPVIHWWHDGKRTPKELALMLGHEFGHITGKKARGDFAEEMRADEYGHVAAAVVEKLMDAGALKGAERSRA